MADNDKQLTQFVSIMNNILAAYSSTSDAAKKMQDNLRGLCERLNVTMNVLTKHEKEQLDVISAMEHFEKGVTSISANLQSLSKNAETFNSVINPKKIKDPKAFLDVGNLINTKEVEPIMIKSLQSMLYSVAEHFAREGVNKATVTELLKGTASVASSSNLPSVKEIAKEVSDYRASLGIVVQKKQEEKKVTEETLKTAKETLKVEKEITEEKKKQATEETKKKTRTPKKEIKINAGKRGRKKKEVIEETVEAITEPAPSGYKLGSLIPAPSTALTVIPQPKPTQTTGTSLMVVGQPAPRMGTAMTTQSQWMSNDRYANPQIPLGLPLHSEEELKKMHLHNLRFDVSANIGDAPIIMGGVTEENLRKRSARGRAKHQGAFQVRNTGSAEAIMLGSSTSGTSNNSFDQQAEDEKNAKNRRKFVADLATAILANQKKNPITDILKWGVLLLGKHLPVIAAGMLVLAPLLGIFRGIKAFSGLMKLVKGGSNVTKGARGGAAIGGFLRNSRLAGLFGLGKESYLSKLTQNVSAQFKNGWNYNHGKSFYKNVPFLSRLKGGLGWGLSAIKSNALANYSGARAAEGTLKWGKRLLRHPNWVSGIAGKGALNLLGKGGSLIWRGVLGGLKLGLRGFMSPLLAIIDGFRGFFDTKGGSILQRLLGAVLKVVTLGFASKETIRKWVGLSEENKDADERRHKERMGFWEKVWAWLKSLKIFGGNGKNPYNSGVQDNTLGKVNDNIRNDADSLSRDNDKYQTIIDQNYTKGGINYGQTRNKLIQEYIRNNTAQIDKNLSLKDKVKAKFNKTTSPEMQAAAEAWADKMMNEKAYILKSKMKSNSNDIARKEAILNNTLPSNIKTYLDKDTNIQVADMSSLGLTGKIWEQNSKPSIAAKNVANLKALDNYLANKGHSFTYTSAMGGHAAGTGHANGNKVDFQTFGKVLTPQEYEDLFKKGYFGGTTGAVGYEYNHKTTVTTPQEYKKLYDAGKVFMGGAGANHYDFTIASGTKAYLESVADKKATETKADLETATATKEEATSATRDALASLVGATDRANKQDRTRNIVLSAVDVTGSLGVWGITQLNNGVMRTGR